MKHLLLALTCGAMLMPATAQKQVPYSSDMASASLSINGGVDPDWTLLNNSRKGKGFSWDRITTDFSTPGTTAGLYHPYDLDYAADCWAISPQIELNAGTEYTISFWAKTRGMMEEESFRLCVANEATSAALLGGAILIEKPTFKSPSDFAKQSATFTPLVSGNYNFGIHCYSGADEYDFYITGFSITDGSSGSDDPIDPSGPRALPYIDTFTSADTFAADWTSQYGPQVVVRSPWRYNAYVKCAEFDSAEGLQEDNWLISPALNFETVGNYLLTFTGTVYGTLNFALGTDASDVSTYTQFYSLADLTSFDETHQIPIVVTTPGVYHFGIQANADTGTLMGYRVNYIKIKPDVAVPALVDDLTATSDPSDALSVTLAWTNPATDQLGAPLPSIEKVEIYRNSTLLTTLTGMTPGTAATYTDLPEQEGTYDYFVRVYNVNGWHDAEPMIANAGFVGHPVAEMPYHLDMETANADDCSRFTILDANADGDTWKADLVSWSKCFVSKMSSIREADEYLATPYLTLSKGYYRLKTAVNARNNSFQVGYATNRHDIENTFVMCAEYPMVQEYGYRINDVVINIPQAGEYVLVVRHLGTSSSDAYLDIKLSEISLTEQAVLPRHAEDLAAVSDNGVVTLHWSNPSLDIAGNPLDAAMPLGYSIVRDNETIATFEPSVQSLPGSDMSYVDSDATPGEHQYSVVISNANGVAEGDAPVVSVFNGAGLEIPYAAVDFSDWQLMNNDASFYCWEADAQGGLKWVKYYGDADADFALTPFLNFEAEKDYIVTMSLENEGYDVFDWAFVHGAGTSQSAIRVVAHGSTDAFDMESETINLTTKGASTVDEAENIRHFIAPGVGVIGIRPMSTGEIALRGFSVEVYNGTGVKTVTAAGAGISYYDGCFRFADGLSDIVICDTAGHVLYSSAESPSVIRVSANGIVMVRAMYGDTPVMIKVKM